MARPICRCCAKEIERPDELVEVQVSLDGRLVWSGTTWAHRACVMSRGKLVCGRRNGVAWRLATKAEKRQFWGSTQARKEQVDDARAVEATLTTIEGWESARLSIDLVASNTGMTFRRLVQEQSDRQTLGPNETIVIAGCELRCNQCAAVMSVGEKCASVRGTYRFCRRCTKKFLREVADWLYD